MLENLLLKLDLESSETSKARWKEVMTIFEEFFFQTKNWLDDFFVGPQWMENESLAKNNFTLVR